MGNNISQKIDAYAQAHLKALKQEEAKTGKPLTKYDIAERMVKNKKLTSGELNSWLKTTEGNKEWSSSAAQKKALQSTSAWTIAGFGGVNNNENTHYTARLEKAINKTPKNAVEKLNAISGYHIKLTETVAERKKKSAEIIKQIQDQKAINPKKALEEQKFKAHIDSLQISEADKNKTVSQLRKEIEQQAELQKLEQEIKTKLQKVENMSHDEKKEFIMTKFRYAAAKKDFSGMKNALSEFNSYMCKYVDDNVGVTQVKDTIISAFRPLDDWIDEKVDDGDDSNLSILERVVENLKGASNAIYDLLGAQGAEISGALAAAGEAAAATGISKAFAITTHTYFGIEGASMVKDGIEDNINAQTKEDARLAGSKLGMGAMMLGGSVKSAKAGYKNIKAKQNNISAKEPVTTTSDAKVAAETTLDKPSTTLKERLNSASSREDFNAIRDEIKQMKNSSEKLELQQEYLKKWSEYSKDPHRHEIKNVINIVKKTHKPEIKATSEEIEKFHQRVSKDFEESLKDYEQDKNFPTLESYKEFLDDLQNSYEESFKYYPEGTKTVLDIAEERYIDSNEIQSISRVAENYPKEVKELLNLKNENGDYYIRWDHGSIFIKSFEDIVKTYKANPKAVVECLQTKRDSGIGLLYTSVKRLLMQQKDMQQIKIIIIT